VAIAIALFAAYKRFSLRTLSPGDPTEGRESKIGRELNQFEQRQLIEWTSAAERFFQARRRSSVHMMTVFGNLSRRASELQHMHFSPASHFFASLIEAEYVLLKPKDGMRLLDLGVWIWRCGLLPLASRRDIEIVCVTNFIRASGHMPAEICKAGAGADR